MKDEVLRRKRIKDTITNSDENNIMYMSKNNSFIMVDISYILMMKNYMTEERKKTKKEDMDKEAEDNLLYLSIGNLQCRGIKISDSENTLNLI
jgi:hypothetical protein